MLVVGMGGEVAEGLMWRVGGERERRARGGGDGSGVCFAVGLDGGERRVEGERGWGWGC